MNGTTYVMIVLMRAVGRCATNLTDRCDLAGYM